jgi:large subunit ribosomal protein L30
MTDQAKHKTEARKPKAESRTTKSDRPAASSQQPGARSIRIQWFRSAIAAPVKHKRVVQGLGFTRLNQIIEREDSPSIRGMVNKVPHLVKIVA